MLNDLVADAHKVPATNRESLAGAIFHSDHGSVYTSKAYAELRQRLGVLQSMCAFGTSVDNAMAESFNATLKREALRDAAGLYDELSCRRQVFRWLTRYKTMHRYFCCRYQSSDAYECAYTDKLTLAT